MALLGEYPHRIFITFPFGQGNVFQIPVPPETISGGTQSILKTYNLVALGEVLSLGGIKLERVKWQSHFPKVYDNSIEIVGPDEHIDPETWRDMFMNVQTKQDTIRVTIRNTSIDMKVGISSFTFGYVPGPAGDMWYQVELIEEKLGTIREFDGVSFPSATGRLAPKEPVEVVITEQGDTLSSLSQEQYGLLDKWFDVWLGNLKALYGGSPKTTRDFLRELFPTRTEAELDEIEQDWEFWRRNWSWDDELFPGMTFRIPRLPGTPAT